MQVRWFGVFSSIISIWKLKKNLRSLVVDLHLSVLHTGILTIRLVIRVMYCCVSFPPPFGPGRWPLPFLRGSGFESSRLCSLEELAVFCFAVYLYLPGTVFREQFGQNRFGLVLVEGLFPETMGNSCLYNRFISWMAPLGIEDCSGRYGLEIRTFPMTGECSWDQLQVRDDDVCSIFSHGSILCRIWAGKYIIISDLGVGNGPISVPFNWSCACVTQ